MMHASRKSAAARAPLPSTPDLADLVRDYERAFAEANVAPETELPTATDELPQTLPAPPATPSGMRLVGRPNAAARGRRERRAARGRK